MIEVIGLILLAMVKETRYFALALLSAGAWLSAVSGLQMGKSLYLWMPAIFAAICFAYYATRDPVTRSIVGEKPAWKEYWDLIVKDPRRKKV